MIKTNFTFRKNNYSLIQEGDDFFVFRVQQTRTDYYEVFKKKIAKERKFPDGRVVPEHYRYPNDEAFGSWAWCCSNPDRVQFIIDYKFGIKDTLPCFEAFVGEDGQTHYRLK